LLERWRWPGNARELKAVMTRAALMHDEEVLRPEHLPAEVVAAALAEPDPTDPRLPPPSNNVIPTLADVELAHIRRVLEVCDGNRTVAAQHLGITRQTLARRLGTGDEPG
jgi:transcriptional regulator with PAS, ATPase and Fis domain